MTRYLMIFWYIVHCLRLKVNPWRFFQLNARYFDKKKGIYSKQDINRLIPQQWRLEQHFDTETHIPKEFPVFLKPEWGQNSYGIYRADSPADLKQIRNYIAKSDLTYLIQDAAREALEFEVFYIRDADNPSDAAVLTITEVSNGKESQYPINGIYNIFTDYWDRTTEFNGEKSGQLWKHLRNIGQFRMARVGIKSNSEEDLLAGRFHIVEINLFTPMPLNLQDKSKSWMEKARFIETAMHHTAKNTARVFKKNEEENIFFKKLIMHYKLKP